MSRSNKHLRHCVIFSRMFSLAPTLLVLHASTVESLCLWNGFSLVGALNSKALSSLPLCHRRSSRISLRYRVTTAYSTVLEFSSLGPYMYRREKPKLHVYFKCFFHRSHSRLCLFSFDSLLFYKYKNFNSRKFNKFPQLRIELFVNVCRIFC